MLRLRLPDDLLALVRTDLDRPHAFAAERVGVFTTTLDMESQDEPLVLGLGYEPVDDGHYVPDETVGARIGTPAIRAAMQRSLDTGLGLFHVHAHSGRGVPGMSRTDARGIPPLVRSFRAVQPHQAHGAVILSDDEIAAWVWLPGRSEPVAADLAVAVGRPLVVSVPDGWSGGVDDCQRYDRQSFLGRHAQAQIETVRIGVVGVGGGGSHVVQQALHLGFRNVVAFDGDTVEDTNLNRLVLATTADVEVCRLKVEVGRRAADALLSEHAFMGHAGPWEERPDLLTRCDLVVGCVDTFAGRRDLEAACRRALVPYIDIGIDVHRVGDEPPRLGGQIIASVPGGPCMHCLGYLTDEKLAREAEAYGAAGGRPQVVFANGVVASTAVALGVDLVTGWSGVRDRAVFLSYDGNNSTLTPDPRLRYLTPGPCPHYPASAAGPPRWTVAA